MRRCSPAREEIQTERRSGQLPWAVRPISRGSGSPFRRHSLRNSNLLNHPLVRSFLWAHRSVGVLVPGSVERMSDSSPVGIGNRVELRRPHHVFLFLTRTPVTSPCDPLCTYPLPYSSLTACDRRFSVLFALYAGAAPPAFEGAAFFLAPRLPIGDRPSIEFSLDLLLSYGKIPTWIRSRRDRLPGHPAHRSLKI